MRNLRVISKNNIVHEVNSDIQVDGAKASNRPK